jgi:hypothetical protein
LNAFNYGRAPLEGLAMNLTVGTYLGYLLLSAAFTVWVARTLHTNGRVFLVDVFRGNEALADSVNHLLVVGFYLVNLGYVALALRLEYQVGTPRVVIEALSGKLGRVLLVLGAMHFFNLVVLGRIRKRACAEQARQAALLAAVPAAR